MRLGLYAILLFILIVFLPDASLGLESQPSIMENMSSTLARENGGEDCFPWDRLFFALFGGLLFAGTLGSSVLFIVLKHKIRVQAAQLERYTQTLERRSRDLQRQKNFLHELLDTMPQYVFWKDRHGKYQGGNRRGLQALKLSDKRQLPGRDPGDFFSPEDTKKILEYDRQALESREPLYHQEYITLPGNGSIWAETHRVPLLNARGEVEGLLVICSDISDRLNAEARLRISESRHRTIFEYAPIGITQMEEDGHLIYANPACHRMLGYEKGELQGKTCMDLIWPHDLDSHRQQFIELLQGDQESYTLRLRYRHRNGHPVWTSFSVASIRDHEGKFLFAVGMLADITKQIQVEAALHESERFAHAIIDALPSHICVLDQHGKLIATNRAWREYALTHGGPPLATGVGSNYLQVCESSQGEESESARLFAKGLQAVLNGEQDQFFFEYPCLDSVQEHWFSAQVACFSGSGPRRLVVAHQNITERKRVEQRLYRQNAYHQALADCSRVLLGTTDDHDEMRQVLAAALAHLQKGINTGRIYLYQNIEDLENGLTLRQFTATRALPPPSDAPGFEDYDPYYVPWKLLSAKNRQRLEQGYPIGGPIDQIFKESPEFGRMLSRYSVTSLQVVPLHIKGYWWGILGVDDYQEIAREWDEQEILLLQTAASLISTFLQRHNTEAALRESELKARSVVEALNEGVVLQNARGEIINCNPAAERILGQTRTQLLASDARQPAWRMFYEDGQEMPPEQHPAMLTLQSGKPTYNMILGIGRQDGQFIWTTVNCQPVFAEEHNPRPASVVVSYTNITVLKHNQEMLERRQQVLDMLRRILSGFMEQTDLRATSGLFVEELLKLSNSQLGFAGEIEYRDDNSPCLRIYYINNIAWDQASAEDYRIMQEQGYLRFCRLDNLFGAAIKGRQTVISNDPAHDPRGGGLPPGHPQIKNFLAIPVFYGEDLIGLYGLANKPGGYDEELLHFLEPCSATYGSLIHSTHLLRARSRASQALVESEQRLQFALRAAGAGTFYCDPDAGHNYWDDRSLEIFGISRENFQGGYMDWARRLYPEDLHILEQAMENASIFHSEDNLDLQYRILRPDQSIRHIHSQAFMIRDNSGQLKKISGLHFDISEQKQAETDLIQAREAAEAANRAKSTFLANMSHELRTPLNALMGYAQILQHDGRLSEEQQEKIDIIYRSGEYLLTLINDILDLAKIEAGRFELMIGSCDLKGLLAVSVEIFSIRARNKGIQFNYQPSDTLPGRVRADEKRLRQILFNLLSNAVKFTEKGEVRLEADYQNGELNLNIRDTGVGISKQDLNTIFHPFQQAGSSEYKIQGTGLGLTITRNLIELMKGRLEVHSEPGVGSLFQVYLPFDVEEEVRDREIKQNTPPNPTRPLGYWRTDDRKEPLRLLVVDDVRENRKILHGLLQPLGFEVLEAENGEEAIQLAHESQPSLIFMDLVMPDINGIEATRRILSEPGQGELPIVAVSASAFREDQDKSLAAGCRAHLNKPVKAPELFAVLEKYLPLHWEKSEQSGTVGAQGVNPESGEALPREMLQTLAELAESGDIQGVREQLKLLEQTISGDLGGQLRDIKEMVGKFQLKALRERVRSLMDKA